MTSYGFPHHGYRSFTFVQDDALPFPVILNGDKNALWERRKNRHVAQSEESRVIGQNVLMVNPKNKQEMNRIYEVHATQ